MANSVANNNFSFLHKAFQTFLLTDLDSIQTTDNTRHKFDSIVDKETRYRGAWINYSTLAQKNVCIQKYAYYNVRGENHCPPPTAHTNEPIWSCGVSYECLLYEWGTVAIF